MSAFYDRYEKVHGKSMHDGQIAIARAYFNDQRRIIMSQWGRNGAKTETNIIIACLACMLNRNFQVYIICPERKQGYDIYWKSKRLQNFPPPEYVQDEMDSQITLNFKGDSFICIEGCENYKARRGIKPDLVIYDEFQDHSKEFDVEVMRPNLLAKRSALIVTGTPPKNEHVYYYEFKKEIKKAIERGDTSRLYMELPTSVNPAIDKEELERIRTQLIESDNEAIWRREYLGQDCFGGAEAIFPTWNPNIHWKPHDVIMPALEKDRHKLKWITVADPGTATCFAVLFGAYNPYTSQLFLLDEIYETERRNMNTKIIYEKILEKEKELAPGVKWKRLCDEHGMWFANEVSANFGPGHGFGATQKNLNKKENQISVIRMLMSAENSFFMSNRCKKLRWEMENYVTNEAGDYPDEYDHLIDDLRYLVSLAGARIVEKAAQENRMIITRGNIYTPDNHYVHRVGEHEDWTENIVEASLRSEIWEY